MSSEQVTEEEYSWSALTAHLCYSYCLGRALYLARFAGDAGIVIDDDRFLSFVPCYFFHLKDGDWTYLDANSVSVALV
jgi:hypothetical protein